MAYSQEGRACESVTRDTKQVASHNGSIAPRQDKRLFDNSPAALQQQQHREKLALQLADEEHTAAHQPRCVNRPLTVRGGPMGACIRIGVAIDPLCPPVFPHNLPLLIAAGAHLLPFSPLSSSCLPAHLDALYLPLSAHSLLPLSSRLASNLPLLRSLSTFASSNRPVWAESGGLLLLSHCLHVNKSATHRMASFLPLCLEATQSLPDLPCNLPPHKDRPLLCSLEGDLHAQLVHCFAMRAVAVAATGVRDCIAGSHGSRMRGWERDRQAARGTGRRSMDSSLDSRQDRALSAVREEEEGGEEGEGKHWCDERRPVLSAWKPIMQGSTVASCLHLDLASHSQAAAAFVQWCSAGSRAMSGVMPPDASVRRSSSMRERERAVVQGQCQGRSEPLLLSRGANSFNCLPDTSSPARPLPIPGVVAPCQRPQAPAAATTGPRDEWLELAASMRGPLLVDGRATTGYSHHPYGHHCQKEQQLQQQQQQQQGEFQLQQQWQSGEQEVQEGSHGAPLTSLQRFCTLPARAYPSGSTAVPAGSAAATGIGSYCSALSSGRGGSGDIYTLSHLSPLPLPRTASVPGHPLQSGGPLPADWPAAVLTSPVASPTASDSSSVGSRQARGSWRAEREAEQSSGMRVRREGMGGHVRQQAEESSDTSSSGSNGDGGRGGGNVSSGDGGPTFASRGSGTGRAVDHSLGDWQVLYSPSHLPPVSPKHHQHHQQQQQQPCSPAREQSRVRYGSGSGGRGRRRSCTISSSSSRSGGIGNGERGTWLQQQHWQGGDIMPGGCRRRSSSDMSRALLPPAGACSTGGERGEEEQEEQLPILLPLPLPRHCAPSLQQQSRGTGAAVPASKAQSTDGGAAVAESSRQPCERADGRAGGPLSDAVPLRGSDVEAGSEGVVRGGAAAAPEATATTVVVGREQWCGAPALSHLLAGGGAAESGSGRWMDGLLHDRHRTELAEDKEKEEAEAEDEADVSSDSSSSSSSEHSSSRSTHSSNSSSGQSSDSQGNGTVRSSSSNSKEADCSASSSSSSSSSPSNQWVVDRSGCEGSRSQPDGFSPSLAVAAIVTPPTSPPHVSAAYDKSPSLPPPTPTSACHPSSSSSSLNHTASLFLPTSLRPHRLSSPSSMSCLSSLSLSSPPSRLPKVSKQLSFPSPPLLPLPPSSSPTPPAPTLRKAQSARRELASPWWLEGGRADGGREGRWAQEEDGEKQQREEEEREVKAMEKGPSEGAGVKEEQPGEFVTVEVEGVHASEVYTGSEAKEVGELVSELDLADKQQQQQQQQQQEEEEEQVEEEQVEEQAVEAAGMLQPMEAGGGLLSTQQPGAWLVALHPVITEVVTALGASSRLYPSLHLSSSPFLPVLLCPSSSSSSSSSFCLTPNQPSMASRPVAGLPDHATAASCSFNSLMLQPHTLSDHLSVVSAIAGFISEPLAAVPLLHSLQTRLRAVASFASSSLAAAHRPPPPVCTLHLAALPSLLPQYPSSPPPASGFQTSVPLPCSSLSSPTLFPPLSPLLLELIALAGGSPVADVTPLSSIPSSAPAAVPVPSSPSPHSLSASCTSQQWFSQPGRSSSSPLLRDLHGSVLPLLPSHWLSITASQPEVLLLVSEHLPSTLAQIKVLSRQPGFWTLPAVLASHVFILHTPPSSPHLSHLGSQSSSLDHPSTLWSPWSLVHCVEQIASILHSGYASPSSSSAVLSAASSALTGTHSYSSLTSTSGNTTSSGSESLPSSVCSSNRSSCNNLTSMTCWTSELGMHPDPAPTLMKSSSRSSISSEAAAVVHKLVCSDPHRHRVDWNPQLHPWKPTPY